MKEYRVETLPEGDSFHQMKLNEWAKEGWRCVSVAKTLSGAFYTFYLERDKPEESTYPYRKTW